MKRFFAVALVLCATLAGAQEIGTEIAPPPPPPTPENKAQPVATAPSEPVIASAGKGAFGIRATYIGQSLGVPQIGAGVVGLQTGTVGAAFWATDNFTLLFDVGFGLGLLNAVQVGFLAQVGFDYHFRTPNDALRPLINVQVGVGSPITNNLAIQIEAQVAGGAAYFFSRSFSITGRLGLGTVLAFPGGNFRMTLSTFTPSLGAAWYF